MPRAEINKGDLFGFLEIVKEVDMRNKRRYFKCKCTYNNCNNYKEVRLAHLMHGAIVSCGCYNDNLLKISNTKHGLAKHPLYYVWKNMKRRCLNKNHPQYYDYGGRGIKICKQWLLEENYEGLHNFIKWNDSLPSNQQYRKGLEIDRKNNQGNYKPSNCRWVDCVTQVNNRRTTLKGRYKGQLLTVKKALELYGKEGLSYRAAIDKFSKGYSIEQIIKHSVKRAKAKELKYEKR